MEIDMTVARILFRYDVRLAPESKCCAKTPMGEKCQYKMMAWMVSAVDGPVAQFKRRKSEASQKCSERYWVLSSDQSYSSYP